MAYKLYVSLGLPDIIENAISDIEPTIRQDLTQWANYYLSHTHPPNPAKSINSDYDMLTKILNQLEEEIKTVPDSEISRLAHEIKSLSSNNISPLRRLSTRTTLNDPEMDLQRDENSPGFFHNLHSNQRSLHRYPASENNKFENFFESSTPNGFNHLISPYNPLHSEYKNDVHIMQNDPLISRPTFYENPTHCITPDDIRWLDSCKNTSQRMFGDEVYSTPKGFNHPIIDSRPYSPMYNS